MNSEEYEAAMKEYEDNLTIVDKPRSAQQVFMTMIEMVGDGSTTNLSNPEAEPVAAKEDGEMADVGHSHPLWPPNPPPP
jgi:hypothetical protein